MEIETEQSIQPAHSSAKEFPFVSIIMPVFNEERYIARILEEVLKQNYPAERMEIIVADGASTDQTRDIVVSFQREHANVRLIYNPDRIVSTGLNRAIGCAQGDVIVRLDGHCEYPRDYVRRVVRLREQLGADSVGGVLVPIGSSYVQKAIGVAYYSPVGIGGNALKAVEGLETVREVDSVHGGCWLRERLRQIGGFDEEMVRNQDDELSFRLRKSSGRIYQSTYINVKYHVRDSFRKLFMQFAQYGYWKVRVVKKHPRQASVRHFVPATFVLLITICAIAAPFTKYALYGLSIALGMYFAVIGAATFLRVRTKEKKLWPGIMLALVSIHFGYGGGFILGCLRACVGALPTDAIFERTTR
jgi:succinoglycan biosynthesis protein ExoA